MRTRESVLLELKKDLGTGNVFNAAKSRYMKERNPMVKFTGVKVTLISRNYSPTQPAGINGSPLSAS